MLGAIIGDIVGSRFEFNPTNDYNFELFTEKCSFTDDTICTVAVADALLKGKDYGDSIHEWCRKYPNPMGGYGGSFRKWVMSDEPKPYNSFGNGSAMRVSPIGWWCTLNELFEEAKKSAACTHNHEQGIEGALAVAIAIYDCYEYRAVNKDKPITKEVMKYVLDHAKQTYFGLGDIELDIEKYRNKFDETCLGTVPVALWIVMHSRGFEDAVRQAVSLGADADTLGAITGSIAEALWGIPEWMKVKAMSYLPSEMKDVVNEFHHRLGRLRKLSRQCTYYKVGEFNYVEENKRQAYVIEKCWAQDLSKSYEYADIIKTEIGQWMPLNRWQDLADEYDLPLSLLGYLYVQTKCKGKFSKAKMKAFEKFLDTNYKHVDGDKRKAMDHKMQVKIMMSWKLWLNPSNQGMGEENPMPSKAQKQKLKQKLKAAQDPNAEFSECPLNLAISVPQMEILRRGHSPQAMEDHWLMYSDNNHIRYYRSWTGQLAFEAHYLKKGDAYCIDRVRICHHLMEFGVNGDLPGVMLFIYLITAETGGDAYGAWEDYLDAWEIQHKKDSIILA